MIDAFAQYSHYYDHLLPVWNALPDKGTFYISPIARREGKRTRALGPGLPTLVAGFGDIKRTRHREHIFLEHGAGENWGGIDPHYSGGPGRGTVGLFLNTNERVHEANKSRYPEADHVLTGSPRMEYLKTIERKPVGLVVSFHWDNRTFDATSSALNHYIQFMGGWAADSRIEVRGHAHPRIFERAEKYFLRAGIEMIREFEDVVRWADVYACDNSSTIFEAYVCGIPVVLLDAPWHPTDDGSWRFDTFRDIGLHSTGEDLIDVALRANDNRVVYDDVEAKIFGPVDGATLRAAKAIEVKYDTRTSGQNRSPVIHSDHSEPTLFGVI